jgi:anti-anti-sigma factor
VPAPPDAAQNFFPTTARFQTPRNGISTHVDGSTAFVRFHDEVDITAVVDIEQAFLGLTELGVKRLVVDFSDAAFVDSKAIEAVMRGARSAKAAGLGVAGAGATGSVARAIDICGLEHAMPVYADSEQAVAAL